MFKAKIIEGTTPPAPKIKIFLPLILKFKFLIALVKPNISVLCPTKLSLLKLLYLLTVFVLPLGLIYLNKELLLF